MSLHLSIPMAGWNQPLFVYRCSKI